MGFRLRRSAPRQSRPSPTSTVEPQPSASSPSSPQRRSPRRPRIALWRVLAVHPPPLTLEQVARIDLSQLTAKSACFKRGLRSTNLYEPRFAFSRMESDHRKERLALERGGCVTTNPIVKIRIFDRPPTYFSV